jgi:hypothetical protein
VPTLLSQSEVQLSWPDLASWSRRSLPPNVSARTPGVHLSGVLKAVLTAIGKLKEWQDLAGDDMPVNVVMGVMWEQWVVGMPDLKDMVWQPGEVELDGVYMSPDGLMEVVRTRQISTYRPGIDPPDSYASRWREEVDDVLELQEFKATWKSEHTYGKDILQATAWIWQLAGYCKAMGLTQARLHVLWVNGDYRPPRPKFMRYRIGFTQEELDKFWRTVILPNKEKAHAEG